MKKTERSGANATTKSRTNKSFIKVKMFEPVNKKITISSESDSLQHQTPTVTFCEVIAEITSG